MAGISRLSRGPRHGVDQPVAVDGYIMTFWQALSEDGDQYASTPEIAEILVSLHPLTAPDYLRLPQLAPFANAAQADPDEYVAEPRRPLLPVAILARDAGRLRRA